MVSCGGMGQNGLTTGTGALAAAVMEVPLGISPIGGHPTMEPIEPRAGLQQAKQLTGREYNPTNQQKIRLKFYWARSCPPEQDPVFPTQSFPSESLHKPLSLIHQRADRRSKKKYNFTVAKAKTTLQKLIRIKNQAIMSQMKGKIKPRKTKWSEICNFTETEFRIMIVRMIQDLRGRMEKIQ